jgi:hypothetical protein
VTLGQVELYGFVQVYSVELEYMDGHEARGMVAKLSRYGVILDEYYVWGTDLKNRPQRTRVRFTVLIPREKHQPFTAMLAHSRKNLGSSLVFQRL